MEKRWRRDPSVADENTCVATASESNTEQRHKSESLSDDFETDTDMPTTCDIRSQSPEIYRSISKEKPQADSNTPKIPLIFNPKSGSRLLNVLNPAKSGSRLHSDYDEIKSLGKGGYGDVIKAKNKIDGKIYAIKRVPLKSTKKEYLAIQNEVNLLSSLDHKNIVRYFSSWMDFEKEPLEIESSSGEQATGKDSKESDYPASNEDQCASDYESNVARYFDDSLMDLSSCSLIDELDEEETQCNEPETPSDNNESIEFAESVENTSTQDCSQAEQNDAPNILCIQMEYCERGTLRESIEEGLSADSDRIWRLMREICEGLSYIHVKGIVHRDLKPENIFLSSYDHVKIGDFGLSRDLPQISPSSSDEEKNTQRKENYQLTSNVGTAYYTAPEIMQSGKNSEYNEKADVYSLGITFFEMCYRPISTGMEKVQIFTALRRPCTEVPEDFGDDKKKIVVLKTLLSYEADRRPNVKKVIAMLPPPPERDEQRREIIKETVQDRDGQCFSFLMETLFTERDVHSSEKGYHMNVFTQFDGHVELHTLMPDFLERLHEVKETLTQIFLQHGAVNMTHLPIDYYYGTGEVNFFMDKNGSIIQETSDHKVSLGNYMYARSCDRYCGSLKRFTFVESIGQRVEWPHIFTKLKCNFDIVCVHESLLPEVEIFIVFGEIINKFPKLKGLNCYILVNHLSLVQAVLLHFGIPESAHGRAIQILQKHKKIKLAVQEMKAELQLDLPTKSWHQITDFLGSYGSLKRVMSKFRCIIDAEGEASQLAKKGWQDLRTICTSGMSKDISNFKISVKIGMLYGYDTQVYSGVLLSVSYCPGDNMERRFIASGGCYDQVMKKAQETHIKKMKKTQETHIKKVHAVGIIINMDSLLLTEYFYGRQRQGLSFRPYDILVYGREDLAENIEIETMSVAKRMWEAGMKAYLDCGGQAFDEVMRECDKKNVPFIIVVKMSKRKTSVLLDLVRVVNKDYELVAETCVKNIPRDKYETIITAIKDRMP